MEGAHNRLVDMVQTLSNLKLAVLVCLVAEQHCLIQSERRLVGNVEQELKLVGLKVLR